MERNGVSEKLERNLHSRKKIIANRFLAQNRIQKAKLTFLHRINFCTLQIVLC